jgi:hypothetical protein
VATLVLVALLAVGLFVVRRSGSSASSAPAPPAVGAATSAPLTARLPSGPEPSWDQIDDPAQDGWDTEVFQVEAGKQLKALGQLLTNPEAIGGQHVADLIAPDFSCGALQPGGLITAFEDRAVKVERLPSAGGARQSGDGSGEEAPLEVELPLRGAEGLAGALQAVATRFAGATERRFEIKVFRVVPAPGEVSTRQYIAISGRTPTGIIEQHATWTVRWAPSAAGKAPRMRSIRVDEFEQSVSRQSGGGLFADCTGSVLGGNGDYAEQFLQGMNHWFERTQETRYFALLGTPGLAVGDVNGDGLDDLYVCQEAGLPNRLFLQDRDGTAREQSEAWGVNWLESSRGALLVDLDNDADQDLVVAVLGGVIIAENNGEGQFKIREVLETGDDTMSLSAVDYDADGRSDLYVCVYTANKELDRADTSGLPGAATGNLLHDANQAGANSLFRNEISGDGTWRFTDVTLQTGLDVNNRRWSFAASWDDFDNDGDPDLYVANDYGRDNLYRNDPAGADGNETGGRRFVDISEEARVESAASGMSISWGDYNRDGWMDAYVGNMWSSAGNRVMFQDKFKPELRPEIRERFQRLARGSTLLRNLHTGVFDDQSAPAAVEVGRWAWSSPFVDVNNDGWEDIVVANGFITADDTGDL